MPGQRLQPPPGRKSSIAAFSEVSRVNYRVSRKGTLWYAKVRRTIPILPFWNQSDKISAYTGLISMEFFLVTRSWPSFAFNSSPRSIADSIANYSFYPIASKWNYEIMRIYANCKVGMDGLVGIRIARSGDIRRMPSVKIFWLSRRYATESALGIEGICFRATFSKLFRCAKVVGWLSEYCRFYPLPSC